jgi:ferredoxin
MKSICKVGCIACGACVKAVGELFEVKADLAEVNYKDYDKAEAAPAGEKCPTKVIVAFGEG